MCAASCSDPKDQAQIARWYTSNCGSDNSASEHTIITRKLGIQPSNTSTGPTGTVIQTSPPPSSLSTGAKAGIGVSAAFAFFAALAAVFLSLLLRRRRPREKLNQTGSKLETSDTVETEPAEELDSTPIFEAQGFHRRPEADSRPRHDLEGAWQGHEIEQA